MALSAAASSTRFAREQLDGDTRFLDPQIASRLGNLELVARYIVEGFLIGLHKSPYHGFSSEFVAYRKYAKGDPFKFIDWKAAAKTDRLYIKQFEENTNTRSYILLDASGSMRFGGADARPEGARVRGIQKWEYARTLAAAFAYLMTGQGDATGLAVFRSGEPELIPPRRGTVHLRSLYGMLHRAQPDGPTDTEKGLLGLPERLGKRGLVVVISDLLDDTGKILALLKALRARRQEVIVFQVLAPEELEFPYRENIEFIDAENGQTLTAQASYIAEAYLKALRAHNETLASVCTQQNIELVRFSTEELLSTALLAYVSKRLDMR